MRGQPLCGAKTRKGTECRTIAMANGRCKLHGGKATGAKNPHKAEGAANPAYSHGIYTKFYRDEEKALIDEGKLAAGKVDAELELVRVRLKRAVEAKERWEAERRGEVDGADEETSMVLAERVDDEAVFEGSTTPTVRTVKRIPAFDDIIDRCLARIESLEKTRKELAKKDDGGGGGEGDGNHVTFSGGLEGGSDEPLPSPFDAP